MGKCFTLPTSTNTQRQSGVASGLVKGLKREKKWDNRLQVIADFHRDEVFGTEENEEAIYAGHFENGFRYFIHSPSVVSYLSSDGVSVSAGSTVYSALTANKVCPIN